MYKLLLWLTTAFILVSCSEKHEGASMNIETKINKITEWNEHEDHVQFTTIPSGSFIIGSERVSSEFWDSANGEKVVPELMHVAILEDAFHDEDLVAIEFDINSKEIQSVYLCIVDNLAGLGKPNEEISKIKVHMLKKPSLYYLDKNNKNFNHIYNVLSEAYNNFNRGVEVAIAVPPGEYFIEDAVIVTSLE